MADKKGTPDPLVEIERSQEALKANIRQNERMIDKAQSLLDRGRRDSAPPPAD